MYSLDFLRYLLVLFDHKAKFPCTIVSCAQGNQDHCITHLLVPYKQRATTVLFIRSILPGPGCTVKIPFPHSTSKLLRGTKTYGSKRYLHSDNKKKIQYDCWTTITKKWDTLLIQNYKRHQLRPHNYILLHSQVTTLSFSYLFCF